MDRVEFLDQIKSAEAEAAAVHSTFGGMFADEGVRIRMRARDERLIAEAAILIADVIKGRRRPWILQEAMTTSDFPLYMGAVVDRTLVGRYNEWPAVWPSIASTKVFKDFKQTAEYSFDGLEKVLDKVEQQQEYPESTLVETETKWKVDKYGRRTPLSWEAIINDDLDAFADIPDRFARAARRTEDKLVTQTHFDVNGPHASLYTTANKNRIHSENLAGGVDDPKLTIASLQQAFTILMTQKDADGEPILIESATLEVPPALKITAENILNAIQIEVSAESGGTANQKLWAVNWMRQALKLVVNPYIPIVAATANGNTTWAMHSNPVSGRAAFKIGFLRGHETPGIYVKDSNQRRAGGGESSPLEGDFDTDSYEQKVRHVVGATRLDVKLTVASKGLN